MIVFLLSGLWHGANWTYVMWGGVHGAYHIIGDLTKDIRKHVIEAFHIKTDCFSFHLLKKTVTFILVTFAWIFFRSQSITDSFRYITRIVVRPDPWVLFNGSIYSLGLDRVEMKILVVAILILFSVSLIKYVKKQNIDEFLFSQNIWFEWGAMIILICIIFVFGVYGTDFDPQQFIYFQF